MRLWKAVLTVLVLANWFACALHCQAEAAGLLHKASLGGASSPQAALSAANYPDSDICDWVVTGGLDASDTRVAAPVFTPIPVAAFVRDATARPLVLPADLQFQTRGSLAPPALLRSSVHFVLRTALPARAPSLA